MALPLSTGRARTLCQAHGGGPVHLGLTRRRWTASDAITGGLP